ncbi:MAG TPA: uracil-DNA glycosylase [Dehalococcoidia bacterium]|jgi:DNA polymerase
MLKQKTQEKTAQAIVYGEGPLDARIMLVGQNPGKQEAKQGKPFVGMAGKYLNEVLARNNIDRNKLYITSIVKQTTPRNRKPTAQEINYWMPQLIEEIKRIKPGIILLMGRVAWKTPRFEGIRYIETYHPAAAMRFPGARDRFERDMKELKAS